MVTTIVLRLVNLFARAILATQQVTNSVLGTGHARTCGQGRVVPPRLRPKAEKGSTDEGRVLQKSQGAV